MCGANSEKSIFRVIVGVKTKNKGTKVSMNNPRLDCDKICVKISRGSASILVLNFNKMEKASFNECR